MDNNKLLRLERIKQQQRAKQVAEKEIMAKKNMKVLVDQFKAKYRKKIKKIFIDKKKAAREINEEIHDNLVLNKFEKRKDLKERQKIVKEIREYETRIFSLNQMDPLERRRLTYQINDQDIRLLREKIGELKGQY